MLPYNLGIEYALGNSLECFLLILITTACNKSVKEVTRPFKKATFSVLANSFNEANETAWPGVII